MNPIKFFFLFVISATLISCENDKNKSTIIVAGDSWAFFTCVHKSLDEALLSYGIQNAQSNDTCALTSTVGARAEKWLNTDNHKNVLLALNDPRVKVLYLSLGGNDLINYWKKSFTDLEFEEMAVRTRQHIADIVTLYHAKRPDIKILVSGYDYPKFVKNHPISAYENAYQDMEEPTPLELNSALAKLSESFFALNEMNQTHFIHHLGVMHYHFGNKEVGLASQTTRHPKEISVPGVFTDSWGGDLRFQSDNEAMQVYIEGEYKGVVDAFHLSKKGFLKLAEHSVEQYLKDWLKTSEVSE